MKEKWTDEEMILTLYIYLTHDPDELRKNSKFLINFCERLNMFTGMNRSPDSIEMRISNYKSVDPLYKKVGLANGGKNVSEFWNKYHNKLDYMSELYNKFVNSTYKAVSDESVKELDSIVKSYVCDNVNEKDSFIESTINVRNGAIQRIFRDNLIIEFNQKCALCDINKKNLLISSHILPYSKCKNKSDMVNHFNGLLLCPNHDALFDKRLISFDRNGKIIISKFIPKELYKDLNINSNMRLETKFLTEKRLSFLEKHMKN